jgi:hypothetical protein
MRHVAQQAPEAPAQTQQVLAIPLKRYTRRLVQPLSAAELEALLQAADAATPSGRPLLLGHESPTTTHHYIELDLQMKERCLRKLQPAKTKPTRFKPTDALLRWLNKLRYYVTMRPPKTLQTPALACPCPHNTDVHINTPAPSGSPSRLDLFIASGILTFQFPNRRL